MPATANGNGRAAILSNEKDRPDADKIKELPTRFESGAHGALRLAGDLLELDTTQPLDMDALAEQIRPLR
jgi:hypothetical protein